MLSHEDFKNFKELETGETGVVYRAIKIKNDKEYAIKKCKYDTEYLKYRVDNEIYINSKLNHPNIVRMYGNYSENNYMSLVFEYAKEGDLLNKLPLSIEIASFYLRQIVVALKYCHSIGIIHRDIKPENILVYNGIVKLCDFGFSQKVDPNKFITYKFKGVCGTPRYIAPEIMINKHYTYEIDYWSIGVLAFDLVFDGFTAKTILNNQNIMDIAYNNKWPKNTIPAIYRDFISSCLKIDPSSRISFTNMLEHPALKLFYS